MTDKPGNPVTGVDVTIASLRNRIDELETLLRNKEPGNPPDNDDHGLEGIPVLDEVINTREENYTEEPVAISAHNDIPDLDPDRLQEIIKTLEKQINDDLERLIKLLKHSIMKNIKTTLQTELGNRRREQDALDIDDRPGPENEYGNENSGKFEY